MSLDLEAIRERVDGICDLRDLYQEVQDLVDLLAEVDRLRKALNDANVEHSREVKRSVHNSEGEAVGGSA